MTPTKEELRRERIELACMVLDSTSAKEDFKKAAALFPNFSVFWNEDERHASLERDGLTIEFWDLT